MVLVASAILLNIRSHKVASALLLGLGCITRYAGVFFVPPLALAIARRSGTYPASVSYVLVAVLPVSLNFTMNFELTGNATDRHFAWYSPSLAHAKSGVLAIAGLVLPTSAPVVLRESAGLMIVAMIGALAVKCWNVTSSLSTVAWCIVSFAAGTLISLCFFGIDSLDGRILSLAFPLVIVVGCWALEHVRLPIAALATACLLLFNALRLHHP